MDLSNTRVIPALPTAVWEALNDPAVLKDCLPGCESFEPDGDGAYKVALAARVGPVSARFSGRMAMSDVDAPNAYTLRFEGQGGAAGFAKGEARVSLAASGTDETALTYVAKAQVGGKLAQIGSRLIDGAAAKMADDFFARFAERLGAGANGPNTGTGGDGGAGADAGSGNAATTASRGSAAAAATRPGGKKWIRYGAIAVIVILLIILYLHDSR